MKGDFYLQCAVKISSGEIIYTSAQSKKNSKVPTNKNKQQILCTNEYPQYTRGLVLAYGTAVARSLIW